MQGHAGLSINTLQCLLESILRELCVDASSADAGNDTPVVQVDDRAVVALHVITEIHVGEIDAPLLIALLCSEILLEKVLEHLVRRRPLDIVIPGLPGHGSEPQLLVHVTVDRQSAQVDALIGKKILHLAVSQRAI